MPLILQNISAQQSKDNYKTHIGGENDAWVICLSSVAVWRRCAICWWSGQKCHFYGLVCPAPAQIFQEFGCIYHLVWLNIYILLTFGKGFHTLLTTIHIANVSHPPICMMFIRSHQTELKNSINYNFLSLLVIEYNLYLNSLWLGEGEGGCWWWHCHTAGEKFLLYHDFTGVACGSWDTWWWYSCQLSHWWTLPRLSHRVMTLDQTGRIWIRFLPRRFWNSECNIFGRMILYHQTAVSCCPCGSGSSSKQMLGNA